LLSVTVRVTALGPTSLHVKEFGETESEAIPQASLLPLSTSIARTEALPPASSYTITLLQRASGCTLSSTVTVATHVSALPLSSLTVSVTALAPTSEHEKLSG